MEVTYTNLSFEGAKNPKLRIRRKQIKRLKQQEIELVERNKSLENSFDELLLPLKKVSTLPATHPDMPIVSRLWKLKFDVQYNFINGSFKSYVKSKKAFAEEAIKNLSLLQYVNNPIQGTVRPSLFSKTYRNVLRNTILDKFRIKTKAEKQLNEFAKNQAKKRAMEQALGIRR